MAALLQSLRWRLDKAASATDRCQVLASYVKHDILHLRYNFNSCLRQLLPYDVSPSARTLSICCYIILCLSGLFWALLLSHCLPCFHLHLEVRRQYLRCFSQHVLSHIITICYILYKVVHVYTLWSINMTIPKATQVTVQAGGWTPSLFGDGPPVT